MPRSVDEGNGMVMLTGNSHPDLAKLVCTRLGIGLANINVYKRSNSETAVDIAESVRGKHVFILQSSSKDVNNDLMETLTLIYACKTSSAKAITVVMPFLPYSKQCRMLRRSAITMKLVADMICKCGATRLVSLDLYKKEIQGFFSIPVDNLRASPFLLQYVRENIHDYRNGVIVAKSPGVMHKATSYADRLRLAVAVIHGEDNKDREDANEDGRQSPPPLLSPTFDCPELMKEPNDSDEPKEPKKEKKTDFFLPMSSPSPPPNSPPTNPATRTRAVSSTANFGDQELKNSPRVRTISSGSMNVAPTASYELFPIMVAKEKPPMTVVGDVEGRIAFLVDDIIDEVQAFVSAAEVLKRNGAKKVYVLATHGLLSADAPELLENSYIDQVIVTNTVPHELQKSQCHKITTVDISLMLCEAIRRIYHKESMGVLFKDVTIDD